MFCSSILNCLLIMFSISLSLTIRNSSRLPTNRSSLPEGFSWHRWAAGLSFLWRDNLSLRERGQKVRPRGHRDSRWLLLPLLTSHLLKSAQTSIRCNTRHWFLPESKNRWFPCRLLPGAKDLRQREWLRQDTSCSGYLLWSLRCRKQHPGPKPKSLGFDIQGSDVCTLGRIQRNGHPAHWLQSAAQSQRRVQSKRFPSFQIYLDPLHREF